jgi:hypothetical protein
MSKSKRAYVVTEMLHYPSVGIWDRDRLIWDYPELEQNIDDLDVGEWVPGMYLKYPLVSLVRVKDVE